MKLSRTGKKKGILSILLAIVLVLSMVATPVMTSYADDEDPDDDDYTGFDWVDNDEDEGDYEEESGEYIYSLTTSVPSQMSLGTITQGKQYDYTAIPLTNTGSTDISLIWYETDLYQVLTVDAPNIYYLEPGDTTYFYVAPNSTAPTGSYTVTMLFADQHDTGLVRAQKVNISLSIVSSTPTINSVTVSPGNVSIAAGSSTTFSATVTGDNNPDTSVDWSLSGNTDSATNLSTSGVLTVGANEKAETLTVRATSRQDSSKSGTATASVQVSSDHTLSLKVDPAGAGNVSGAGTVADGGSMTVLAAANSGYNFAGWYNGDKKVSDNPSYTQSNIKSDMTLTAKFVANSCYVDVRRNNNNGGTVTQSQYVPYNGSITLKAQASDKYRFDGWVENNSYISRDPNFTLSGITSDRTITASFTEVKFDVVITPSTNAGKVYGAGTYNSGNNVIIKAEAYDGWEFKGWTLNGNLISTNASYTINNIGQDYSFVAVFEEKHATKYTMTAGVCSDEGTISPSGDIQIAEGNSLTYTITPKSGYRVLAVAVDGKQVGAVNSYTFTNIKGNHRIVAAFIKNEDAVVSASNSGKTATTTQTKTATTSQAASNATVQERTDTVTPVSATVTTEDEIIEFTPEEQADLEDMNLNDTAVEYDTLVGLQQLMNITSDDVKNMVTNGDDMDLMNAAANNGYLTVTVQNEYSPDSDCTPNYSNTIYTPNLVEVVDKTLTLEDKLAMSEGKEVTFSVGIYRNNAGVDADAKTAINAIAERGVKIGDYFDFFMMKTVAGNSTQITELPVGMQVTLDVPEELKAEGRVYYIIRAHKLSDGTTQVSLLNNLSADSDKITFTTDKFSTYAIGYVGGKNKISASNIIIIILVSIAAVLALVICISAATSRARRRRRAARARAAHNHNIR